MRHLLSAVLCVGLVLVASIGAASVFETGGDRLIEMQNPDGGWGWVLTGNSASNTAAPTAMGLLASYAQTGDIKYLNAAVVAGDFVKGVSPPHSTGNGIFMHALSQVTGDSSYAVDVKTEFYDALQAGTYDRSGTLYDTAAYAQHILDLRASQGYGNLGIWDVGLAAVGAARLGADQSQLNIWGDKIESGLNSWEGSYASGGSSYSVIGLAGGVYGLAALGHDLANPISGSNYLNGTQTAEELADILVGYQAPGGGFGKFADYPLDLYTGVQETAYAILALSEVDRDKYSAQIYSASNWLVQVQMSTGGWGGSFAGASGENNEVTGEALWAIGAAVPEPTTLLIWSVLGVLGMIAYGRRK